MIDATRRLNGRRHMAIRVHCDGNRAVPHPLLNEFRIRSPLKAQSGKRMPQVVQADIRTPRAFEMGFEPLVNGRIDEVLTHVISEYEVHALLPYHSILNSLLILKMPVPPQRSHGRWRKGTLRRPLAVFGGTMLFVSISRFADTLTVGVADSEVQGRPLKRQSFT